MPQYPLVSTHVPFIATYFYTRHDVPSSFTLIKKGEYEVELSNCCWRPLGKERLVILSGILIHEGVAKCASIRSITRSEPEAMVRC
jgi:hypothetical protein